MATHDSGIVDQMKRRVIELVSGQVVRDERSGGYQTQSVPVQNFNLTGSLVASSLAAAQPPARETRVDPEQDAAPATGAIEIPVAPQRVVAAPAPVNPAPARTAASQHDPG